MPEDLFSQPDFPDSGEPGGPDDDLEGPVEANDAVENDGAPGSAEAGGDDGDEDVNVARGGAARAVLMHVTSSLVDDPGAVELDATQGRGTIRFAVRVAPGDMGRVIGRRGRTVRAIRALVRAAAAGEGMDASVAVDD
ncbi:MAG: KH domain-containing protein [Acidimicrobiales bacterium]